MNLHVPVAVMEFDEPHVECFDVPLPQETVSHRRDQAPNFLLKQKFAQSPRPIAVTRRDPMQSSFIAEGSLDPLESYSTHDQEVS